MPSLALGAAASEAWVMAITDLMSTLVAKADVATTQGCAAAASVCARQSMPKLRGRIVGHGMMGPGAGPPWRTTP